MLALGVDLDALRDTQRAPTFLGSSEDVSLVTEGGRRFAAVGEELKEVVVATAAGRTSTSVSPPFTRPCD